MANSIGNGFRVSFRSLKETIKSSTFYQLSAIFIFLSLVALFLSKGLVPLFPSISEFITSISYFQRIENPSRFVYLFPALFLIVFITTFLSLVYSRILINNAQGKKGIDAKDIIRFIFLAIPVVLIVGGAPVLIGMITAPIVGSAAGGRIIEMILKSTVTILSSFYEVYVAAERRLFASWKSFFVTVSNNILNYIGFSLFAVVAIFFIELILILLAAGIFLGLNLHNSPNAILYAVIGIIFLIAPWVFFGIHVLTRFYLDSNNYRGESRG